LQGVAIQLLGRLAGANLAGKHSQRRLDEFVEICRWILLFQAALQLDFGEGLPIREQGLGDLPRGELLQGLRRSGVAGGALQAGMEKVGDLGAELVERSKEAGVERV